MTENRLFKRVTQIGLVVRDVEATARRCWEDFGIGPWAFYTFDPSNVEAMTVHGQRVDHAMRTGHAKIGDFDWEIIEPLDDRSIYAEHLTKCDGGLHHVLFEVDEYIAARKLFELKGYVEVTSGKWAGSPYGNIDTQRSLGCIAELWSPPEDWAALPPPDGTYP